MIKYLTSFRWFPPAARCNALLPPAPAQFTENSGSGSSRISWRVIRSPEFAALCSGVSVGIVVVVVVVVVNVVVVVVVADVVADVVVVGECSVC